MSVKKMPKLHITGLPRNVSCYSQGDT